MTGKGEITGLPPCEVFPRYGEILSTGDYRLKIYLDGNLAASGTFKVL